MYLPSDQACDAANGLQVPTAQLAASAAGLTADSASMNTALAAFNSVLTRSPSDFWSVAPMVAKDVGVVNAATGVNRGGALPGWPTGYGRGGPGGPGSGPGGGGAGKGLYKPIAGSGGSNSSTRTNGESGGGSCDVSSAGGCNVVPLNGPGSTDLPQTNAQAAPLTTPPINPGLGRAGDGRRRFSRPGAMRGLGQCCTGLPAWGDAFPAGGPLLSTGQDLLSWFQANPLLTLGLALGGIWIASKQNEKGKRG